MSEHLFTRRQFLGATAAFGLIATSRADEPPVKLGAGSATFALDPNWGQLPIGMKYGYGCAIVADGRDRIIVTSRSTNPCVAIFDANGKLLETWSKELSDRVGYSVEQIKDTAHGLYWSHENEGEFLYWTENVSTNRSGPKFGKRVYKTDMQAKILFTLGPDEKESSTSLKVPLTSPTDVAVAPNGDVYVVDGYGSQMLYRFNRDFKQLGVIGGRGKDHGKFDTCHGVWINTLKKEPELYIADRANNRVEVFSLELEYKRTISGVRKPCCFYQHGGRLYVPELDARVSIFDENDKLVAHLGDGKGVPPKEIAKHPDKFATPHALTLDSKGNFYVLEWLDWARPRKFTKV
jgi:peptidylamidoglycolate lyase